MTAEFDISWIDHGREPQCKPDPNHPTGKDIDASHGSPSCYVDLPYPAKRCGLYLVKCNTCDFILGITTAGRPDDPRSVRIACARK
jgi:hypothetical protein